MQVDHAYLWERHVTLKAFWRLLLQGREAGESGFITTALTWVSLAAVGGGLAWTIVRGRSNRLGTDPVVHRDRLISATIIAMPLLMPFYFDYDLLLLSIPATLYAAERISDRNHLRDSDVWLTAAWVCLFLCLFVNPAFALHTHISATVILLSTVSTLSVCRVNRVNRAAAPVLVIRAEQYALAA
jgi:hypothetical protein